jgi:hypothetical protein
MTKIKAFLPTFFALAIAALLAVAAFGKMFYPIESLEVVDRCVSIFEGIFLVLLLIFRRRVGLWLFSSVVFGSWCGYALHWYFLEVPCSCMGKMLKIPTLFTLSVDLAFVLVSLGMARFLRASGKQIYFTFLCTLMAGLVGYAFSDWVYVHLVPKP